MTNKLLTKYRELKHTKMLFNIDQIYVGKT